MTSSLPCCLSTETVQEPSHNVLEAGLSTKAREGFVRQNTAIVNPSATQTMTALRDGIVPSQSIPMQGAIAMAIASLDVAGGIR